MSFYRISYRLIGLFMIVVALWRMSGGGEELVKQVKTSVSGLISRKEVAVMRPYYPDDVERDAVEAVDAVSAPTPVRAKSVAILNGRGETPSNYYSDWYPAQR